MIQQKDDSKTTYQFDEKQLMQTTGKKMYAPVNGGFGVAVTYRNVSLDLAFSYSLGKWLINEISIIHLIKEVLEQRTLAKTC